MLVGLAAIGSSRPTRRCCELASPLMFREKSASAVYVREAPEPLPEYVVPRTLYPQMLLKGPSPSPATLKFACVFGFAANTASESLFVGKPVAKVAAWVTLDAD